MKNLSTVLLLLLSFGVFIHCPIEGDEEVSSSKKTSTVQTEDDYEDDNEDDYEDDRFVNVIVTNYSTETVTELYLSPTSDLTWGPNQISYDLMSNDIDTIIDVPCGVEYDAYVNTKFESYYDSFNARMIPCGELFYWDIL